MLSFKPTFSLSSFTFIKRLLVQETRKEEFKKGPESVSLLLWRLLSCFPELPFYTHLSWVFLVHFCILLILEMYNKSFYSRGLDVKQVNGVSHELSTKKIQCFDWWICSKMHAVFCVSDVQNLISWYLKSFDRTGKEHKQSGHHTKQERERIPYQKSLTRQKQAGSRKRTVSHHRKLSLFRKMSGQLSQVVALTCLAIIANFLPPWWCGLKLGRRCKETKINSSLPLTWFIRRSIYSKRCFEISVDLGTPLRVFKISNKQKPRWCGIK